MFGMRTFIVDGESVSVPEDELEDFYKQTEDLPFSEIEEADTLWLQDEGGTKEVHVPQSASDAFQADMASRGVAVEPLRMVMMDDGQRLTVGMNDLKQLVDLRRSGLNVGRKKFADAEIPEIYGRGVADRNAVIDKLGEMYYPEEQLDPDYLPREENLGDKVSNAVDAAGKWMDEGSQSGEFLPMAAKGLVGTAGRFAKGFTDTAASALRIVGADKAAGLPKAISDALPTELPDYGNDILNKAADVVSGAGATAVKYGAAPWMVPADVATGAVDSFVETFKTAQKNGVPVQKALALATARSGFRVADVLTDASAIKSLGSGVVKRIVANTGLGMAFDAAGNIVEQGARGEDNPDLAEAGKYALKNAPQQVVMGTLGAASALPRKAAARKAASDAHRAAQERETEAAKEVAREEARTRYEGNLSDEARADIETRVNDMVKTGVIPSYRHAQEVERLAAEKLGNREAGESTERVEQAVMEAAQEVADRLQTPERVTSPALERRQTEAKMRENEAKAKARNDYYADEAKAEAAETERKGAEINADLDAQNAEHARREADIKKAFNRADDVAMKKAYAERKREAKEYERTEAERKARETAEEPEPVREEPLAARESAPEPQKPRTEEWPEYAEWLRKSGRKDTNKNWNRYVAENELDPALKVDRTDHGPSAENAEAKEMGDRIEAEGEAQRRNAEAKKAEEDRSAEEFGKKMEEHDAELRRNAEAKEQAEYEERMARREEAKANPVETPEDRARKFEAEKKAREDKAREEAEAKAQAVYDERMTAYEEARARRAEEEAAKKRGKPVKELTKVPEKPDFDTILAEELKNAKKSEFDLGEPEKPVRPESVAEQLSQPPEKPVSQSTKAENSGKNDYPTVVDKSGKRRLTGIAAQRKAASDAEKAMRDKFASEDPNGAGAFSEWNERGRLFNEPPYKIVRNANGRGTHKEYYGDPADEAINHLLNGVTGVERERLENLLFGKKGKRVSTSYGGNDTIYQGNDYERVIGDFMKASEKYDKFRENGGKTLEEQKLEADEAEARAREVKLDGDSYDIEYIETHGKADKAYNEAVAEVDAVGDGSPFVKNFSREQLKQLKKGDTIRFDHSEADYEVESYDAKNNEIVVSVSGVKDNPLFTEAEKAEMTGRRFRLTENGWIELNGRKTENGNERKNAEGADENLSRDAQGEQTGDFALDGGTAGEIAAEQKRIADRKEIERRQNAPLKTGNGEVGQDLMDLGGAEGEDLFNRTSPLSRANAARAAKATAASARLAKTETADLQDQRGALLAAQEQGDKSKATAKKVADIEAELNRRGEPLELKPEQSIEMRSIDPKRRSRAEVVEWAKKSGRQVIDGKVTPDGMREYDAQMAQKAKKAVKRLFPDMTIEYYEKAPEKGGKAIDLRNHSGDTLGWFELGSKKVVLLPGADAETVAHEIGWHGVRDWASRNSPNLFAKMREVEDNVDPALRSKVLRIYRKATGYSRDDLLNEFGAWSFMGRGGKALEEVVSTREGAAWYAKMLNAAKDVCKDFAAKHGGNRIDLSKIDTMTGEQLMDFMAKEIAGGKTLGEIGAQKPSGSGNAISTKETRIEKMKRKVYDIGSVFRAVEKDIAKKTGSKVASDDSVDQAFGLKAGLNEATSINLKAKIADLKESYAKYGISHEDFAHYMACKAATGRDAKVDAKNIAELQAKMHDQIKADWGRARIEADPAGFKAACDSMDAIIERNYRSSNGSNIPPAEAAKTVREWETGEKKDVAELIRYKWRELIEETIGRQVEAGLISKEQADLWKQQEPEYVPFKSPIDELTGEYVGRSDRNFARAEHHQAKGRETAAGDVLTHALMDWQATQNRAVDNEIRQKLAKMVEANPELGTVEKLGSANVREKKTKDKFTKDGRILLDDGGDPNAVVFKRNGESYVIRLNGTRGTAMAAALTGRNLSQMPKFVKGLSRKTASLATEHSLTFSVRNAQKDLVALTETVMAERGVVNGTKFMGHFASAQKDVYAALWKYVTTGKVDANTTGGEILRKFIDSGGMIGGYEKEAFAEVSKELSLNEITKELKRGSNVALAVGKHTLKSVSYLNKMSELMSRVSAFEAERRMGTDKDGRAVTDKSAALFSRRLLTDFNRAGENTGFTNVFKMFSNASVGGQARALAAVRENHKGGTEVLTAMATWGAAQAIINHYVNAEDDKEREEQGLGTGKDVGEWEIRSSFANIRAGDKMYKLGQHEDVFTFASYVGNVMARVTMGEMSVKDAAKNLGVSAAELAAVFTGMGDANLDSKDGDAQGFMKAVALYLTPSVLQPVGEIAFNQDYAGRKVYTETFPGNKTPRSELGRKGTPEYAKTAAKKLYGTFGDKVDVQPEIIQKLVEGYGKNALKDAMNIYEVGKAIMNGEYEKLEDNLKPFKRDFVRKVPDSTDRYFKAVADYKKAANKLSRHTEWKPGERKAYMGERKYLKVGSDGRRQIDCLIDGNRKSGVWGINDLRHLENGEVLRKNANGNLQWVQRKTPPTDEQIEKWRKIRLRKQAKVIELVGE